jgi:transposase
MTTKNINIPLNIKGLRVLGTEITENGIIIIDVESEEQGTHCHQCGRFVQKFHGCDRPILLRHLPILDQPVYLRIRPKRWRCDDCDHHPTTTQTCDGYHPNAPHTKAYEQFILRELVNSTVVDVSVKQAIGQDAVLGIVDRHIPVEPNWDGLKNSRELGIDEISLKKGHQDYVTVISSKNNLDEVSIITVLEDRKKATVKKFLESIPLDLKPQIHRVCSDMYEGFINAAHEALPNADVVIDRFHVAKDYRGCADLVRKRELKRLKQELSKEEYQQIQHTMWPFRKAWDDLNEDEQHRLSLLFSYSAELKQAYLFRDLLTQIFEKNISKSQALAYFKSWQELVENSGLAEFKPFLTTLKQWSEEIGNYFLERESSGFVEGLNNKIKVLKRRCYGIFNLAHLRQRLRLDLEGYGLFGHREQNPAEC